MAYRVLFVDDEPDLEMLIRQRYRKEVRKGNMALEFASSGLEALEVLDANPDCFLVMTDINMPGMNGLQLLQSIRQDYRDVTVVIISAYGDMANIRTAMNYGSFDFLTKPIDFNDLEVTRQKALEHIDALLEKKRLTEEKSRLEEKNNFIRDVFGRYLSDTIVEVLLESDDGLKLGGERRSVTMLMSDLRGFSILAERFTAEQIIATLNHYYGVMIDLIIEHGGIIDEIQGDSILAIFGAPLRQENSALQAAACAIAMQKAMQGVNQHNADNGLPVISMGIGVHTGEVVLGNIGSDKRTKYGVVGSDVNLAARIQTRCIGGQVVVTEATLEACQSQLDVGPALEFRAKGFEEPATVFDLRGLEGRPDLFLPSHTLSLRTLSEEAPIEFVSTAECGDSSWQTGFMVGLSESGIEIRAAHKLESSEQTMIRFLAEEPAAPGTVYAKVVDNSRDDRFRAWFVALSEEAQAYLREWIASYASTEALPEI